MRDFKVKTIVKLDFNDSKKPGVSYEEGEELILDRVRYEELYSKGFVEKGEEIKEEKKINNKKEEE